MRPRPAAHQIGTGPELGVAAVEDTLDASNRLFLGRRYEGLSKLHAKALHFDEGVRGLRG